MSVVRTMARFLIPNPKFNPSDARARAGRGQAPPATPLKARFASADGSELITVVSSESSKVKPTFLQARPPAWTR